MNSYSSSASSSAVPEYHPSRETAAASRSSAAGVVLQRSPKKEAEEEDPFYDGEVTTEDFYSTLSVASEEEASASGHADNRYHTKSTRPHRSSFSSNPNVRKSSRVGLGGNRLASFLRNSTSSHHHLSHLSHHNHNHHDHHHDIHTTPNNTLSTSTSSSSASATAGITSARKKKGGIDHSSSTRDRRLQLPSPHSQRHAARTRGSGPVSVDNDSRSVLSDIYEYSTTTIQRQHNASSRGGGPTTTIPKSASKASSSSPSSSSLQSWSSQLLQPLPPYYHRNPSDAASASGSSSVCNGTISSHDTVKMSNKTAWNTSTTTTTHDASSSMMLGGSGNHTASTSSFERGPMSSPKMLKRWNRKIKGFFSASSSDKQNDDPVKLRRLFEEGEDAAAAAATDYRQSAANITSDTSQHRGRCNSDDGISNVSNRSKIRRAGSSGGGVLRTSASTSTMTSRPAQKLSRDERAKLDQAIRGRLDGMAVLPLGPAHRASLNPTSYHASILLHNNNNHNTVANSTLSSSSLLSLAPNMTSTTTASTSTSSTTLPLYRPEHILLPIDNDLNEEGETETKTAAAASASVPYSFTGESLYITPGDLLQRMLWQYTPHPHVILEGYFPDQDRWMVRIDALKSSDAASGAEAATASSTQKTAVATSSRRRLATSARSSASSTAKSSSGGSSSSHRFAANSSLPNPLSFFRPNPTLTEPSIVGDGGGSGPLGHSSTTTSRRVISPVVNEDETSSENESGAPVLSSYQLWHRLWGTNGPMPDRPELNRMIEEDPLLHLAAEHSIPIDLDEQSFCISERSHVEVIHGFLATCVSVHRLDAATLILNKLIKGLDVMPSDMDDTHHMRFVKGATLHNLGILYCWQGLYELAVEQFHAALQERTNNLPKDHPDIAVSWVWKGLAQFALSRFDDALFAHELALGMIMSSSDSSNNSNNNMSRYKVLNNMGVILYHKKDFVKALQQLSSCLEMQRNWLEVSSVRRDSIVLDTSLTLCNMGKLYLERGDNDLAYFVYDEAMLLQTTIIRKDQEIVLDTLMSLALTRARSQQLTNALELLQGCLTLQLSRYGEHCRETMDTLGYLSILYEHLKCHEDAARCLVAVKKWQRIHLRSGHPAYRKSQEALHRLESVMGMKVSVWI